MRQVGGKRRTCHRPVNSLDKKKNVRLGALQSETAMPRRGFTAYQTLYTRASINDASRRFFPSEGPARPSAGIKSVRAQADVYNMTGDVYLQFAFQESDDTENWPAADSFTVIGATTITQDGIAAGAGFENITLIKANVRFGVVIRNSQSGTPKYEFVWVATRFDTRSC